MNHIVLPSELARAQSGIDFLIDGLLPARGVGLLYGETNVGKTAVAMDMAIRIAGGLGFHGLQTHPTHVLYCMAEGVAGLPQRVIAACRNLDVDLPALDPFIGFQTVPTDFSDARVLQSVLAGMKEKGLNPPGLIVIDTYSANSGAGFSENDTAHAKEMGDGFRRVSRELAAMVLVIHHAGWNKDRIRGSSDLLGTVDVSLKLRKQGDLRRVLSVEKARDFGIPEPLSLVLTPKFGAIVIDVENGRDEEMTDTQRNVLLRLQELGGPVKSITWQRATGREKTSFHAIRATLVARQLVQKSTKGYEITQIGLRALGCADTPVTPVTLRPDFREASRNAPETFRSFRDGVRSSGPVEMLENEFPPAGLRKDSARNSLDPFSQRA